VTLLSGIGEGSGTSIITNIVPYEMADALVRRIYRDIALNGLSRQDDWPSRHNAFHHLSDCPEVQDIVGLLECCVPPGIGDLCPEHQLIFQPPDDVPEDFPITPHIDVPPTGKMFTLIAGVPLTDWTGLNGSPHIFRGNMHEPMRIERGSVLLMGPLCTHSPGINRESQPRIGLYVRWMADAES
jgi:hypothetical protein